MTNLTPDLASLVQDHPEHLRERTRIRTEVKPGETREFVLYWSHHALRSDENPALDTARHLARQLQLPLLVYQGLSESYRYASDRHHTFILQCAADLAQQYQQLDIAYLLHVERTGFRFPRLARLARRAAVVVTDDFPVEATLQWTDRLASTGDTSMVLVDTACVVPMQSVGKAYDRAFAYRKATEKSIKQRLPVPWPEIDFEVAKAALPFSTLDLNATSIPDVIAQCNIDHSVGPVYDTPGGTNAGYARWNAFRASGLSRYAADRNSIELDGASRMSAYLHYGAVSPFRIAREAASVGADKYLDELLYWRELAYCFCFYRQSLDGEEALPEWAWQTLRSHANDRREVLSWERLARAQTGQPLWDAAQRSLLRHGELHNNVRMTWGKAIVPWSRDHLQALDRLIDLNHRYALDGRDPASYGGILWCLGQFDRPFFPEQPVFGSVRTRPLDNHQQRTDMVKFQRKVDRPIAGNQPEIAVVGAGIGGLMCARILGDHGLTVRLFDKSYRPGGRSVTRRTEVGYEFDHGAQYFTIRDHRLMRYLESWIEDGHVGLWPGRIVSFDEAEVTRNCESMDRYVGTPHMESLSQHLACGLKIETDVEISQIGRAGDRYRLMATNGQTMAEADIVLWNCPPAQVSAQVPADCAWQERLDQAQMLPCWAVMVSLAEPWQVEFDGAFVNCGPLAWMARNSSKPGRQREPDCWVFHSSADWARQHLDTSREEVIQHLLEAAEQVSGYGLPVRHLAMAHRWLYARPETPLPSACLWDAHHRLGACGDWCGGPRVEGALLSGMALAGRVLGQLDAPAHLPVLVGATSLP